MLYLPQRLLALYKAARTTGDKWYFTLYFSHADRVTGDIWLQCIVINRTVTLAQHTESVVRTLVSGSGHAKGDCQLHGGQMCWLTAYAERPGLSLTKKVFITKERSGDQALEK